MREALARALGSPVTDLRAVSGGDLNDAHRAVLADGRTVFVKSGQDGYATEAAGLAWLAEPGALGVPEVLAVGDDPPFLALGWIDAGRPDAEALGRGLAAVHAAGAPAFGHTPDGGPLRLGPLALPSTPHDDWPSFYAECRIRPLARLARDAGALPDGTDARLDRICERMAELAGPPEPPARLHGDLWGGNVMADPGGAPVLIDPAAYGGHREIDLAMLRLFGNPGPRTFAAYAEAAPLADGHEERVALHQLLPLLVHAVLFGGGYGNSVAQAAARYA